MGVQCPLPSQAPPLHAVPDAEGWYTQLVPSQAPGLS